MTGPVQGRETERIMDSTNSPLLTDLYELNMMQAYLDEGMVETAVFEFFVRKLPERRSFLVAAGLDQALSFLEDLRFAEDDLAWLESTGRFRRDLLDYLRDLRFTGDVHAPPEGTIVFPGEPLLRVTAPLPIAQLVETRLINLIHFQTLIASKAARIVLAAQGRRLVDFGLRRAHGAEAGLLAARAGYIAGFDGTATALAAPLYRIPIYGTMAHSFIQAHGDETAAFEAFAHARPDNLILLIDTYDTEAAARKVAALAPRLSAAGIRVQGVRLDSGDLIDLSRRVRRILDNAGLHDLTIFASGGLDEDEIAKMVAVGAPVDGFGIGTSLTTSFDAPALDCAYKLQEYAGLARRKRSTGKATWPGRKQVWRRYDDRGRFARDVLTIEGDPQDGEALIGAVMRGGRRTGPAPALNEIRVHAARGLACLPDEIRNLSTAAVYPVDVAPALAALAAKVDRRLDERA
jgi:nicotinate phosphoribosyltransferase